MAKNIDVQCTSQTHSFGMHKCCLSYTFFLQMYTCKLDPGYQFHKNNCKYKSNSDYAPFNPPAPTMLLLHNPKRIRSAFGR